MKAFGPRRSRPCPQVAETRETIVELVRRSREVLGPELTLFVDVGYGWRDAKAALRVIRELERYDLFFIETPLHVDNLRATPSSRRGHL